MARTSMGELHTLRWVKNGFSLWRSEVWPQSGKVKWSRHLREMHNYKLALSWFGLEQLFDKERSSFFWKDRWLASSNTWSKFWTSCSVLSPEISALLENRPCFFFSNSYTIMRHSQKMFCFRGHFDQCIYIYHIKKKLTFRNIIIF